MGKVSKNFLFLLISGVLLSFALYLLVIQGYFPDAYSFNNLEGWALQFNENKGHSDRLMFFLISGLLFIIPPLYRFKLKNIPIFAVLLMCSSSMLMLFANHTSNELNPLLEEYYYEILAFQVSNMSILFLSFSFLFGFEALERNPGGISVQIAYGIYFFCLMVSSVIIFIDTLGIWLALPFILMILGVLTKLIYKNH